MSERSKGNFNLPPGTTASDVSSKVMVECPNPNCDEGWVKEVEEEKFTHTYKCPTCHGTGEVVKTKEQP